MGENISNTRSPDKIRDDAIQWFNTIAPLKYNEGQAKSEVLSHQLQKKDSRIAELEKQVEFYKELSQR